MSSVERKYTESQVKEMLRWAYRAGYDAGQPTYEWERHSTQCVQECENAITDILVQNILVGENPSPALLQAVKQMVSSYDDHELKNREDSREHDDEVRRLRWAAVEQLRALIAKIES